MRTNDNPAERFSVSLSRRQGFEFRVDFRSGDAPGLTMDEPRPLGQNRGPNAARVLAAAIGDCLSASLLHCLERARVPVTDLEATVEGNLIRNEQGRLRIGGLRVKLSPRIGAEPEKIERCRTLFEDYCIVTQSVRNGLDIQVDVEPIVAAETVSVAD